MHIRLGCPSQCNLRLGQKEFWSSIDVFVSMLQGLVAHLRPCTSTGICLQMEGKNGLPPKAVEYLKENEVPALMETMLHVCGSLFAMPCYKRFMVLR